MIETNIQVIKEIGLKMSEDDVDGFLADLDQLFDIKEKNTHNEYTTLYKIWLELKAKQ